MAETHDIQNKAALDHDEMLEHLRDYDDKGSWKNYMHVEKEDIWWDAGAYVHCGFLIFICLWNMYVDGYVSQVQFSLNHIITYGWVMSSAIYSYVVVIKDFTGGKGVGG